MAALSALPPAVSALARNPILVAVVALFGLVQLPQLAFQPSQPMLAALVSLGISGVMLLVMPFFQGGLLGMADEGLGGRTGLGTLVSAGKANYVNLLLAYLVLFAINFVFGIVAFFAVVLGGIGLFAGQSDPGFASFGASFLIILAIGLVFVLAYLLVTFFVQFYAHAIVLSDAYLVAGFKRSVGLVRRNLLSTFGYTLILLVGSLVLGGVGSVASLLLAPQPTAVPLPEPSLPVLAVAAIIYVVGIAVLGAFYAMYSVSFYRSIEDDPSIDAL